MPVNVSALSPSFSQRRTVRKDAVRSRGGIVVSQCRQASEIGAHVLAEGGHAIDAAVATAFAVGVLEPWMSGIGGVGAALSHDARTGETKAFDFGPCSPAGLDPADFPIVPGKDGDLFGWPMVEGNRNTSGATAVVAPTEPAGLALLHRHGGRLAWRALLQPAIALAKAGPVVDWHTMLVIASAFADLSRDPGSRERFLPKGSPPVPPTPTGDRVRLPMPELARTLALIADEGAEVLYKGPVARSIAEDVRALGGCLTEDDLAAVKPRVLEPLAFAFRGRRLEVLPELNGGPTLAMAFKELARLRGLSAKPPDAADFTAYAEAMLHAWKHRFEVMGDAGERTAPTSTTHLAVVDREGNVVTLTQTLLSMFGSRVVLPRTGILMNNGINWFDPRPGGPNSLGPGRRALANYAPTIMTGGGEVIGIGGCGGRRIIPAVFQLLAMIAEHGMDLDQAFHAPRIDVSGVDKVVADRRLPATALSTLGKRFDVVLADAQVYSNPFTVASAVRSAGDLREGATEPEHPWSEAVAADEEV